jgi:ATP-dependent metalloprotease FtsH
MVGPSGTGKTLLARATAGEANVPFFSMAGSEFMEMLVGVGASVTGDTPILIKQNGKTKLLPIGEFIDRFYQDDKEGIVSVGGVYTLGFDPKQGFEKGEKGFFGYKNGKMQTISKSSFKKVSSVFRHKVNQIYEIHYLGGVIKTTADHSVFVRRNGRIVPVATKDIKKGDILVELPLNIRLAYKQGFRQRHKIIAHQFQPEVNLMLDVWDDNKEALEKYAFVLSQRERMSQYAIAAQIGVSQATVGNWQNNVYMPQILSKKLVKLDLPDSVSVSPSLLKLFGYYTAEGRGTNNLEFTFGAHETDLHKDVIDLMREIFGIEPVLEKTEYNTLRIKYYSAHLGRFFARHCGNGSHNKHVPQFLWDVPREYFFAFLEGYWRGDGYQTKSGKLSMTSVSKQLILELSWLCSMHGIKVGIKHGKQKGGRIIRNKPLPDGEYWTLIIGKTANPFAEETVEFPFQFKRAIVQKIVEKPYDGFVYDLCGVENEAFFGGEKPVLLHNSRVRDLFDTAKKAQPAIIFIDEVDAIGRQRGIGIMAGHDEREQTLNQILVEMDGFTPTEQLIVMAATNRPDVLDPALIRPGRFDRRVMLDMPDIVGRKAILAIHAKGKPFTKDVDWEKVAKRTVGFSGADLENMLNEAAILTARLGKSAIDMQDIEEAATKVKLGPEKRRLQSDDDRRMTAYHEAGHAIISWHMPHMDPVHRISIVSRGLSLGHTMMEPTEHVHETKTRLLEQISVMLGGRAAESLVFKEMTTGAADDIAKATEVARTMVVEYGMSELGPINLDGERHPFYEQKNISPNMASQIDAQVKKITDTAYKIATTILSKLRSKLDVLAEELLKKETIEADSFVTLLGPKKSLVVVNA